MAVPLHPGAAIALARFSMDEMDIARAVRDGELTSPQKYKNVWLFAIRITGTGAAYRDSLNEFVIRDPAVFLTEEFVARCNGLPVILDHPESALLNGQELTARIIGTIALPYIREDEVWGIAKIWNETAAKFLSEAQFSTSPGVTAEGTSRRLPDGSRLLIEVKPELVDHIAVCARGVWDKGGPPSGVDSVAAEGSIHMAEETKAAEERTDAAHNDLMTKLDSICEKLDSAHSRMDALEERHRKDAEEKEEREDKGRRDSERKDARKDAEEASEDKEEEDEREKGEREENRADKSRRDESLEKWAKEEEKEEAHRDDRRRKDARKDAETEEEKRALAKANKEREDKTRKDAEEKEMEREDKRRADAALTRENADLKQRLASVEDMVKGMTRETSPEERDTLALAQARADSVGALFGERVSAPNVGESPLSYRRRVLRPFLQHSPQFKEARLDSMDGPTLALIENQVFADAQIASRVRADSQPGILIPRVSTDAAGRQITKFDGDMMAWLAPFMTDGARCSINRKPAAA